MPTTSSSQVPFVVDFDGTLTLVDTLHESWLNGMLRSPIRTLAACLELRRGAAAFKSALVGIAIPKLDGLPLRREVLELMEQARSAGRKVVLATGAHERIASQVAENIGLFDEVLSTRDGGPNLVGTAKKDLLLERFGEGGFDYVGNSPSDIEVWRVARQGLCVGGISRFRRFSKVVGGSLGHLPPKFEARPAWQVLRPHQWVKNLLVFLPLAASHQILRLDLLLAASVAFVAFCFAASLVYVLNDLLDRESDRDNPVKASRPIASGIISVPLAVGIATALAGGLVGISIFLPVAAVGGLLVYLAANLSYSFHLKRRLLADVFLLAFLYVWRVMTGAFATGIEPSTWLLGFTGFLFLSLAFAKRYAEVARLKERSREQAAGRAWKPEDALPLAAAGIGCGVGGSILLSLYVTGDSFERLYRNASVALLLSPLFLYWIVRLWIQACRLELHEDPVLFVVRDKVSYIVVAIAVGILAAAML